MRTRTICLAFAILLHCSNATADWSQTNASKIGVVWFVYASGTNLFAGTDNGAYLSTDNGISWKNVGGVLLGGNVWSFAASGSNIFAGTNGNGIVLSTDNGTTWNVVNNGLTRKIVQVFAVSGTTVFAGTDSAGVFRSTNNGTSWTKADAGLTDKDVLALAVAGGNLLAGTYSGIFRSTDNGTSWTSVNGGLTIPAVWSFAVSGTNVFAGTSDGGIFLSTNTGTSWSSTGSITHHDVNALVSSGKNLIAGVFLSGVLRSTDNGTSWTAVNTGLTDGNVFSLALSGTTLFAGFDNGVWQRPLSEIITSVDAATSGLPKEFTLQQNYPNPFNPSTVIRYGLPHKSQVSLMVFNTLGQQVAVLQNGEQEAGYHEVRFDASGLSSGVYYYRLQAGTYVETRKLCLIR